MCTNGGTDRRSDYLIYEDGNEYLIGVSKYRDALYILILIAHKYERIVSNRYQSRKLKGECCPISLHKKVSILRIRALHTLENI